MSGTIVSYLGELAPERLSPGVHSKIYVDEASPKMATPGLAFWGGMTLVAAAEEIGRWYG
ncbi:hypothetical protein GCM10009784_10170 [Arthrobacter parietis]|uniref:Uncharacterized protein n=2 Tax=Arthrobacter TaxID=1663 RepID=A0ABT6CSS2_9MICC|nr:hypothetical protein [Arthrobacter vasquezii]